MTVGRVMLVKMHTILELVMLTETTIEEVKNLLQEAGIQALFLQPLGILAMNGKVM